MRWCGWMCCGWALPQPRSYRNAVAAFSPAVPRRGSGYAGWTGETETTLKESCPGGRFIVPKARRKLASYEVAGGGGQNVSVPDGTVEVSNVLSGRIEFAARYQTLRVWLISGCPFETKKMQRLSGLKHFGERNPG